MAPRPPAEPPPKSSLKDLQKMPTNCCGFLKSNGDKMLLYVIVQLHVNLRGIQKALMFFCWSETAGLFPDWSRPSSFFKTARTTRAPRNCQDPKVPSPVPRWHRQRQPKLQGHSLDMFLWLGYRNKLFESHKGQDNKCKDVRFAPRIPWRHQKYSRAHKPNSKRAKATDRAHQRCLS